MDRPIIYPGQIPLETDLLRTNRYAMTALAMLAQDLIGTTAAAAGFTCIPTGPATMAVQVTPGRLYSLQNLDGTAYSSLAADTTHQIVKQGILLDAITLPLTAPTTVGYSVNYLIQAIYQDTDSLPVTLPYYNSSNPTQAYSGPANSGAAQATLRAGAVVVQAKAGIAAATGTQTTPAADSGYVGLFVVTVAYGAATVIAGNISTYAGYPTFGVSAGSTVFDATQNYVSKTIGARLTGWEVSPIDYPWLAKFDGVTDDTAAINACSTWAATAGYGVKLPKGTTIVSGLLVGTQATGAQSVAPLYFRGEEGWQTIIKAKAGFTGTMLQAWSLSGCVIGNFTLDANNTATQYIDAQWKPGLGPSTQNKFFNIRGVNAPSTAANTTSGTCSFAGSQMTVVTLTAGTFYVGQIICAAGVNSLTTITSFASGAGGVGSVANLSTSPGTIATETTSGLFPLMNFNNCNDSLLYGVVSNASSHSQCALSFFASGGLVWMDSCIWNGGYLNIGGQNGSVYNSWGHGVQLAQGSLNYITFIGKYLYANSFAGAVIWSQSFGSFQSTRGFKSMSTQFIGFINVAIASATAAGTTVTMNTSTAHGMSTGQYVTIVGSTPAAYNGTYQVTVISATQFTYVAGSAPGGAMTVVGACEASVASYLNINAYSAVDFDVCQFIGPTTNLLGTSSRRDSFSNVLVKLRGGSHSGSLVLNEPSGFEVEAEAFINDNTATAVTKNRSGIFAPAVGGSTTSGAFTPVTQTGTYYRIGNRVFYYLHIAWTGATGTGNIRVTGLPLSQLAGDIGVAMIAYTGTTFATGVVPSGTLSGNFISFVDLAHQSAAIALPAAGDMVISGSYEVAA